MRKTMILLFYPFCWLHAPIALCAIITLGGSRNNLKMVKLAN